MASKIKVDNIENQCGGAVVTKCGATTTISGSVVKADDIQAADGGNIINQCGTTITLGASGDTINLASGASQSGFGRTGTVDWQTGSIKTGDFTATSGEGYFVNTTSGAVTLTLPASPSAGDIVAAADYAGTAGTNNITIARNGSNIEGLAQNGVISADRDSITLVFVDATQGWLAVNDNESSFIAPTFIAATGGNSITTSGNYKIHTFTGPGTFTVCSLSNNPINNEVSYIVVAGGGGGSADNSVPQGGAGGGAGGFRESKSGADSYTSSPIEGATNITVTAAGFPITVGGGGAGDPSVGSNGSNSIFSTVTSTGGGRGGYYAGASGASGGSGGGGGASGGGGGAGNTPPVSPSQGNSGSASQGPGTPGAGGGAGGAGSGITGGVGVTTSITASATAYAGGGANGTSGGCNGSPCGTGGDKGGNGTVNRGAGGGGNCNPAGGGDGSSGIVVIRYKFQ